MRIRSIKPEFYSSEDIAAIRPWGDRLLFIGLWSYVDDNGVGRDIEKLIVADLFPLEDDPRETLATVSRGLQNLSDLGRITRYTVENRPYLHITNWDKHQRIDKPNKARYPAPTREDAEIRETLATVSRHPREIPAPGTEEQGNRGTGDQRNSDSPDGESDAPAPSTVATLPARARAIPPGWKPDPDVITAMHEQFPDINLQAEHERFVDYWRGTGKPMKDWNAVWRNWIRRTAETASRPSGSRARTTDIDWEAAADRAAARDRSSA